MATMMSNVYLLALVVYICAWCVTIGGLSATQDYCGDNEAMFGNLGGGFFLATKLGKNCNKFFRFPWLIAFGGLLPLLLDACGMVCPAACNHRGLGVGAPLYAAIVPLNVVMANMFFNLADVPGIPGKLDDRFKVTLSGFAITAGIALLLILLGPMCAEKGPEIKSFTTIQDKKADAARSEV